MSKQRQLRGETAKSGFHAEPRRSRRGDAVRECEPGDLTGLTGNGVNGGGKLIGHKSSQSAQKGMGILGLNGKNPEFLNGSQRPILPSSLTASPFAKTTVDGSPDRSAVAGAAAMPDRSLKATQGWERAKSENASKSSRGVAEGAEWDAGREAGRYRMEIGTRMERWPFPKAR